MGAGWPVLLRLTSHTDESQRLKVAAADHLLRIRWPPCVARSQARGIFAS